jgi:predicted O-methyltransferase YrrM/DNA-binding PadR family transcriptional regulator
MGRHRGGRGFQGFHPGGSGGHGGFGHRERIRGRKIGADDLQLLLLLLLGERSSHGYELIKALEQRSCGYYAPSPGMVYPALTYLTELLYTTVTTDGARKLYALAAAGRAYLEQHRATAEAVMQQLEQFGHGMFGFTRPQSTPSAAPPSAPPASASSAPGVQRSPFSLGASVDAVLQRLRATAEHVRPTDGGPRHSGIHDPAHYADYGFSVWPEQGELMYLLCRQLQAKRIVDFATSVGVSALYLAAALRDNGGGVLIGSEIVPQKIQAATANLTEAGLASFLDLRAGDARETLRDLGGPVDFALIDGWPSGREPSLAREVLEIVAPQIRTGGMILNDNAEPDYLSYVRDRSNGLVSITLPIKGATELSLKL